MTETLPLDEEAAYQAVRSRDPRFDGVFYFSVRTTGIYCRPSCPAVPAKRSNVRFHRSAAAAQAAGYRACRRCRPDAVPGSPEWNVRADLVGRAMRLISDGVVDREGVAGLADRLGYSTRQVNRQLLTELGAGPVALARAQRAHTARTLLESTALPVTDVAFAAGFASVRQFNDTVRQVYDRTPSRLRAEAAARTPGHGTAARAGDPPGPADGTAGTVPLRLPVRYPFDARYVFDFLARHAVPGVEETTSDPRTGHLTHRRTLDLPHGWAVVELDAPDPSAEHRFAAAGRGWLDCRLRLSDLRDLTTAVQRMRDLADLDADPRAVADRFAADPVLGPLAAARPGVRSLGQADPAEEAFRAVVGQQIGIASARTVLGRIAARYGTPLPDGAAGPGGPSVLFPTAEQLAAADPADFPMPAARQRTMHLLAEALASRAVVLTRGCDRAEAEHRLLEVRGIGPWTTGCVRMRGLGDPDVFLAGDMAIRKELRRHGLPGGGAHAADGWRPWRSYATNLVWAAHSARSTGGPGAGPGGG